MKTTFTFGLSIPGLSLSLLRFLKNIFIVMHIIEHVIFGNAKLGAKLKIARKSKPTIMVRFEIEVQLYAMQL